MHFGEGCIDLGGGRFLIYLVEARQLVHSMGGGGGSNSEDGLLHL